MNKLLKCAVLGILVSSLSGCYRTEPPYEELRMLESAKELCKDLNGVYEWGYEMDYGNVICFDGLKKFNVFTKKAI